MLSSKRVIIIIDGSNFYFKLKDLDFTSLLNFKFQEFATYLAENRILVKTTYYVGKVKTSDELSKFFQ